ncbi:MAG TPA: YcxB family protein [Puia sp.]|nr:YcxB family protein [Puia sp.]
MVIHFEYDKKQVLQALRYHFISRPEIKILLILLNVFTILSAILFFMHKIQPLSFLTFSLLWFVLLITIWRLLPLSVYRKSQTFQDQFSMDLNEQEVVLQTERGSHAWQWREFSSFLESPHFFHLYFNSRSFFLVPKDAFKELDALQQARALLKEKLKK